MTGTPKIHPFKAYNSVVFSRIPELCTHHHFLIPEYFHHHKKKPFQPLAVTPYFPSPSPWQPLICFLSLWYLHFLDISYEWDHTVSDLLHLASFIQHHVSKVHPCYSLCQYFTPFYGQILFHCMDGPHWALSFLSSAAYRSSPD